MSDPNIITAKELLKEAEHYLALRDPAKVAQLLDEVERLVVKIAKSQASQGPDKIN